MVINFDKIGGGGGGTSNYNDLSNKPQINGITLNGNKTSSDLGITPNELKAVENVPSAATNGSVFAEYREEEVGYGWQYDSATGTSFTFDISLNPYSGESEFTICYFNYNGNSYQATLQYYEGEDQKTLVFPDYFTVSKGEIKENQEFWDTDLHVTVDYSDITKIVLTFDNDVEISDEITPASSIQVTKELKQAYNQTESATTEWAFWGGQTWQGKAENTEFRMPTNFVMPSGETLVSHLEYYDIPINTYWDGTQFKVEYSLDSGTTWQWAFSATTFGGGDGPITVGPSEGMGKTCELTYAWYYYGDVDKNCFKLSSNKSISHPVVNNFTNDYNVLYFDTFLKSGSSYNLLTENPQINGVELKGNKSTEELGINVGKIDGSFADSLQALTPTDGTDLSGKTVGLIIDGWDGESDMLFTAAFARTSGWWGPQNGQTPYFSGGTWIGLSDLIGGGSNLVILPGNRIYFTMPSDNPRYEFTGEYSGSTSLKMYHIDEITTANTGTVSINKRYEGRHVGFQLLNYRGEGTVTLSANTGDVIVININLNEETGQIISGASINGVDFVENEWVDLSSGLSHFKYEGNDGFLIKADANSTDYPSTYDYFTDLEVSLNESDEPVTDCWLTDIIKETYDAYQYNGYIWDKLAKEYELPAPAPAGGDLNAHWFNFSDGNFTFVRYDIGVDGDYLFNMGPDDGQGSYPIKGVTITNGTIDTTATGYGMGHAGDGHMVGSRTDNGYVSWAHAWLEDGKLYIQSNTSIHNPDLYGMGSNYQGGLVY